MVYIELNQAIRNRRIIRVKQFNKFAPKNSPSREEELMNNELPWLLNEEELTNNFTGMNNVHDVLATC